MADEQRFAFGSNWQRFITRDFSETRARAAQDHLLDFLKMTSLQGRRFLDVGCGSGLHSLAALRAGASEVYSFDYDPNSVAAAQMLKDKHGAKDGAPWTIARGDALDAAALERLGTWDIVYSWGVLHHTGRMWDAIHNVQQRVAEQGLFYLALYSKDACTDQAFWLEVKKEYNRSSRATKQAMALWYVWRFSMNESLLNAPGFVKSAIAHRTKRGMSIMRDIHDWIGGWPMEYAGDQETVDFLAARGFTLLRMKTGEANTEFLFQRAARG